MLNLLLVDDSSHKTRQIIELIERILPDIGMHVDVAQTAAEAAHFLKSARYDLMVLDINLPLREGGQTRKDGGLTVLQAIREQKNYHRPTHIVGLSAYHELVSEYSGRFAEEMWYLIEFDDRTDEWAQQLARKLVHIADAVALGPTGEFSSDLAIITALHKVELEAVLALDASWERKWWKGDTTLYYEGRFVRGATTLSVVAAAAPEMGMPAATAVTMKAIARYRPRYVAMVGIAAGVRGHFGDILIADHSWDYGSGKAKPSDEGRSVFLPAPSSIPLSPHLKARFEAFGLNKRILREIQLRWESPTPVEAPLTTMIGPIASGAAVLENRHVIDELVARNRKLIGIEMETYGVFLAAQQSTEPTPQAMSVKSICDFADARKSDEHQRYAAFTSAQYLYEFALAELAARK